MEGPRAGVGGGVRAGKIHVIGGRGLDAVTVATHEVYDPTTAIWSEAAPLPKARDHMAVVAVAGKIHAIGGRPAGSLWRTGPHVPYYSAAESWTDAAPPPTPRTGAGAPRYQRVSFGVGGGTPPHHTL